MRDPVRKAGTWIRLSEVPDTAGGGGAAAWPLRRVSNPNRQNGKNEGRWPLAAPAPTLAGKSAALKEWSCPTNTEVILVQALSAYLRRSDS